ncbi:hypothetical protein [Leptolyngbya sp. KIOST-1]|uniref:hypothetical protein n=1 Tax=Leptolyngbya sp. KIOST-1 TaxID=1229172 RepID=UPI00068B37E8|nr:hypothetical protein [Leptolyngbya sp. KIOST-1]
MTQPSNLADIEAVHQLLTSYSFDADSLGAKSYSTKALIVDWLNEFGPVWVSHAITEALYQGRYKLISIDQILRLWQRRGQPIRHFNREFESIILGQTLLFSTTYGDGAASATTRRAGRPTSPKAAPLQPPTLDQPEPVPAPVDLVAAPEQWLDPGEPPTTISPAGADAAEQNADSPDTSDPDRSNLTASATSATPPELEPHPLTSETVAEPAPHPTANPQVVADFRPVALDEGSSGAQVEVIQPFVPRRDASELHERLRAVVQGGMRE